MIKYKKTGGESCIHLLLYKCFKQEVNGSLYIHYDSVREIMRRRLHKVPRPLHYEFLKEMEFHNLIKRSGNSNHIVYELIGGDRDKKINKYIGLI